MPTERRRLPKPERQRLVASLVARRAVGTQQALLDALHRAGVDVTQATVSRDIRELGLAKIRDALGRPRYVHADRARRSDPRETLDGLLRQFGRAVTPAQNVVVVQAETGSAPAIARALDRLDHPLVVGTLAGDDTLLVIAGDARRARTLARELGGLLGR
jgi:transcriptional regulator of arginine metabolism